MLALAKKEANKNKIGKVKEYTIKYKIMLILFLSCFLPIQIY